MAPSPPCARARPVPVTVAIGVSGSGSRLSSQPGAAHATELCPLKPSKCHLYASHRWTQPSERLANTFFEGSRLLRGAGGGGPTAVSGLLGAQSSLTGPAAHFVRQGLRVTFPWWF